MRRAVSRPGRHGLGTLGLVVAASAPFALGCSRGDAPRAQVVSERVPDASSSIEVSADSGARTVIEPPASPFALLARGPYSWQPCPPLGVTSPGCARPLLARLPGGGLVFASELARARADGPSAPLVVELVSAGLESMVRNRPVITQSPAGLRWVWADASTSVIVDERDYMRSGPQLETLREGPKGFAPWKAGVGLYAPAVREGQVLALERAVRTIPNSSAYPKGSEYYADQTELTPARVAVLAGKGPAPVIPGAVCPIAMSAARDGTLAIAVEACGRGVEPSKQKVGVLRYAPKATTAKLDWLGERDNPDPSPREPAVFAAANDAIFASVGPTLHTWTGETWRTSVIAPSEDISSLSQSPSGELWAVVGDGKLLRRAAGADAWTEVPLPPAPGDDLDPEPWSVPLYDRPAFLRVPALTDNEQVREPSFSRMTADTVDAAGEDVLVLAVAQREAFVLSTRTRGGIARLPSVSTQRAKLAAALPAVAAGAPGAKRGGSCDVFLALPPATDPIAVKSALGPAPADAGPDAVLHVGDGIVEGAPRLLVWGEKAVVELAFTKVLALAPKRLCGPAVVVRER